MGNDQDGCTGAILIFLFAPLILPVIGFIFKSFSLIIENIHLIIILGIFCLIIAICIGVSDFLSDKKNYRISDEEIADYLSQEEMGDLDYKLYDLSPPKIECSKEYRKNLLAESIISNFDNFEINYAPLVDAFLSEHFNAIKNDRDRMLRTDKYGRVSDKQINDWSKHLIEIVTSAPLSKKNSKLRDLYALALSLEHRIVIGNNIDSEKTYINNFTDLSKHSANHQHVLKLFEIEFYLEFEKRICHFDYRHSQSKKSSNYSVGINFEIQCANLLEENGWYIETTPASGDFGADLLAFNKSNSLAIQCKHSSSKVGVNAVQEVIAAKKYYECNLAAVICNSDFTKAAYDLADIHDVHLVIFGNLDSHAFI